MQSSEQCRWPVRMGEVSVISSRTCIIRHTASRGDLSMSRPGVARSSRAWIVCRSRINSLEAVAQAC
eukprot:scaffold100728_cov35-Tisochrysis_lutea.AAC.5